MFGFVYVVVLLLRTRIFSNTCEIFGRVFAIIMTALSFLELLRKCFSFNRASRSHAKTGLFLALFGNFFLCGFWGCLLWSPVTVLVPKVSPMGLQNSTKIIKMHLGDDFFRKRPICDPLTPVQSKHCFLHAFMTHFLQICCLGGPLKIHTKKVSKITHNLSIMCPKWANWAPKWDPKWHKNHQTRHPLCRSGPEGVPGCTWEHFGILLGGFWEYLGSLFGINPTRCAILLAHIWWSFLV